MFVSYGCGKPPHSFVSIFALTAAGAVLLLSAVGGPARAATEDKSDTGPKIVVRLAADQKPLYGRLRSFRDGVMTVVDRGGNRYKLQAAEVRSLRFVASFPAPTPPADERPAPKKADEGAQKQLPETTEKEPAPATGESRRLALLERAKRVLTPEKYESLKQLLHKAGKGEDREKAGAQLNKAEKQLLRELLKEVLQGGGEGLRRKMLEAARRVRNGHRAKGAEDYRHALQAEFEKTADFERAKRLFFDLVFSCRLSRMSEEETRKELARALGNVKDEKLRERLKLWLVQLKKWTTRFKHGSGLGPRLWGETGKRRFPRLRRRPRDDRDGKREVAPLRDSPENQ